MDMGTLGWMAFGWLAMSIVVSLALGGFLRAATADTAAPLHPTSSRDRVLRYRRASQLESKHAARAARRPIGVRVRHIAP
jgi:hypothetical protein